MKGEVLELGTVWYVGADLYWVDSPPNERPLHRIVYVPDGDYYCTRSLSRSGTIGGQTSSTYPSLEDLILAIEHCWSPQ
jgi:hypothetical protein